MLVLPAYHSHDSQKVLFSLDFLADEGSKHVCADVWVEDPKRDNQRTQRAIVGFSENHFGVVFDVLDR